MTLSNRSCNDIQLALKVSQLRIAETVSQKKTVNNGERRMPHCRLTIIYKTTEGERAGHYINVGNMKNLNVCVLIM